MTIILTVHDAHDVHPTQNIPLISSSIPIIGGKVTVGGESSTAGPSSTWGKLSPSGP
jgi:hypothetical protein